MFDTLLKQLAPVIQMVDSAIHRINLYPVDKGNCTVINWIEIYTVKGTTHLFNN